MGRFSRNQRRNPGEPYGYGLDVAPGNTPRSRLSPITRAHGSSQLKERKAEMEEKNTYEGRVHATGKPVTHAAPIFGLFPEATESSQDPGSIPLSEESIPGAYESVADVFTMVRNRRRLVMITFLMSLLIAATYAYVQRNVYESAAEIRLLQVMDRSSMVEGRGTDSQYSSYVAGQMKVLKSTGLIGRYIDLAPPIDFGALPAIHGGIGASIFRRLRGNVMASGLLGTNLLNSSTGVVALQAQHAENPLTGGAESGDLEHGQPFGRDRLISAFHSALQVKRPVPGGAGNIVQVHLRAYRPEVAQSALQSYLNLYMEGAREQIRKDIAEARAVLREQLARAEDKMVQSKAALVAFAGTNGILSGAEAGVGPLAHLLNKSVERIVEAREAQERITDLPQAGRKRYGLSPSRTADEEFKGTVKQQLAAAEAEYSERATLYSPSFPKMVRLKSKIESLSEKLNEIQKGEKDAALRAAQNEERLGEYTLKAMKQEAAKVNSLQTQYALLQKREEVDRQSYQAIMNLSSEIETKWGMFVSGVSIIEPASLPSSPVAPRRALILLIGALLGLASGVATAVFAETVEDNRKAMDIEHLAAGLNTRPLGVVPDFRKIDPPHRGRRGTKPVELMLLDSCWNPATHAIRGIESAIYFLQANGRLKSAVISSAISQEGKTFLSLSLGIAMSFREEERTLVVDADMREPRLHTMFGLSEPGAGLSTVLSDGTIKLSKVIRPSSRPGLFYMTSGAVPPDPLVLLRSSRFRELFGRLEKHFDNILIDSPPVLACPDYMPLCNLAKGVILVVGQGRTLNDEVRETMRLIRSVPDARLLGVVLNRAQPYGGRYGSAGCRRSRYYYRYSYPQQRTT